MNREELMNQFEQETGWKYVVPEDDFKQSYSVTPKGNHWPPVIYFITYSSWLEDKLINQNEPNK